MPFYDKKSILMRLEDLFERYTGTRPETSRLLAGSGSNRRYWRLSGHGVSLIGAEGTSAEENRTFIYLASHFREKGINVPEVYSVSDDGMDYLQEDLGDLSLFDAVSSGRESGRYSDEERSMLLKTISCLPDIQFLGAEGLDFSRCTPEPEFNRRLVMADLNYFKYCFLKTTGLEFNEAELEKDFGTLASSLLSEGFSSFMYRDFQARNVMLKGGVPYFIDFQGGRRGPCHYDVASFVWQARAGYPDAFRQELVDAYIAALDRYVKVDRGHFMERLMLFVLFRTLQVLGAYGFRGNFERKDHFLRSIPFAVANLRAVLSHLPSDCPYLGALLKDLVLMPQFVLPEPSEKTLPEGMDLSSGKRSWPEAESLEVLVTSFSFRKGIPEDPSGNGGGYVFDCRALPNPGKIEFYRSYTGMDKEVSDFFVDKPQVPGFLSSAYSLADAHVERFLERGFTHLMISFGCTGGQHRSVYCAEKMASHLKEKYGVRVKLVHREQGVSKEL